MSLKLPYDINRTELIVESEAVTNLLRKELPGPFLVNLVRCSKSIFKSEANYFFRNIFLESKQILAESNYIYFSDFSSSVFWHV